MGGEGRGRRVSGRGGERQEGEWEGRGRRVSGQGGERQEGEWEGGRDRRVSGGESGERELVDKLVTGGLVLCTCGVSVVVFVCLLRWGAAWSQAAIVLRNSHLCWDSH